jgi:hypothetical protein
MFRGAMQGVQMTIAPENGGGGGGLTNRTWNIISGYLIPVSGPRIELTGGQLVVQAIPSGAPPRSGGPGEPAAPKPAKGRKK